jgi:TrmH family RNA methyltransferase
MIQIDTVSSRTNPTVRLIRSLYARRSARYREGLFVTEGLRTVQTLIDHRCRLNRLLVDADRLDDVPASLLDAAHEADTRILAVEPSIFAELSDVETAQPVIGVFEIPDRPAPSSPSVVVALDGVQDPGNLGSILRTCRAARVDAVLLSKGTADVYGPKVVRATAGQFVGLSIVGIDSPDELQTANFAGFPAKIIIADRRAEVRHTTMDWSSPFILVLGSEGAGTSSEWDAVATDWIRIDMDAAVESLNVAAAAAVLLFEARRDYAFG